MIQQQLCLQCPILHDMVHQENSCQHTIRAPMPQVKKTPSDTPQKQGPTYMH
jgi:hypothetical protein